MSDLIGRVALITGVTRRTGIGTAVAHVLAAAGANIFTTYYRPFDTHYFNIPQSEPLDILEDLSSYGIIAAGIEVDLREPQSADTIFDQATKHFSHIDILINNAAYGRTVDLRSLRAEDVDDHYAVNVRSMLLLCQRFAHQHDGRDGGRVINFTSGQSITPMPDEIPYSMTKAAIEGLTTTLSRSLSPKRITVNTIDPGPTDTGWITDALRQELLRNAPFGRIGEPNDVAQLVHFLVSARGQWITGQVVRSRGVI